MICITTANKSKCPSETFVPFLYNFVTVDLYGHLSKFFKSSEDSTNLPNLGAVSSEC